ncbi:MAG: hypothetical protein QW303_05340 [Nitrososphaerota archaeon]
MKKCHSSRFEKIPLLLYKICEVYEGEKKTLLNHPKMIQYLFNKPMKNVITAKDLATQTNYPVRKIFVGEEEKMEIFCIFNVLNEELYRYNLLYNKYVNKTNQKSKIRVLTFLPILSQVSSSDRRIIRTLEDLSKSYCLCYTYQWSFGEQKLVHDFYVILVHKNRLIQFVIEHRIENDVEDIVRQYILFQMNVHLLRLVDKKQIKKRIVKFVDKLTKTNHYLVVHGREMDQKNIANILRNEYFITFRRNYQHNHIIYLKMKCTDNEFSDESSDTSVAKEPVDDFSVVSEETFKKLVGKRFFFTKI